MPKNYPERSSVNYGSETVNMQTLNSTYAALEDKEADNRAKTSENIDFIK